MAEVPQKSLERYDVLNRIAVGGMAEVFLAKAYGAHGFEKTLAIKRILPELARDAEFEERFIAEAKVAVQLSHTNVVQVFDFGRFAGSLFIAMEYVDGLDLAALLRHHRIRRKQIPLPAAFQIAIELTRGLDFAHQHGVVHRDVSPSNILLSRAGEVKIADFGIAVAAHSRREQKNSRRKVMGKWRYMSPEQARGEEVDTRSDLFSAASVMYELFTSEKLFPGDEAEDIIRNIQDMTLPRMTDVRPGLPPRLDEILRQALARRPDERPVRAAIMLRALTELSYESSIVATSMDVAEVVAAALDDTSTPTSTTIPPRKGLDELIRKQLAPSEAGADDVGRRTDVAAVSRVTAVASVSEVGAAAADDGADGRTGASGAMVRASTPTPTPAPDGKTGAVLLDDDSDEPGRATVIHTHIGRDGLTELEADETTIAAVPWVIRDDEAGASPARPSGRGSGVLVPDTGPAELALRRARAPSLAPLATAEATPTAGPRRRWVSVAGMVVLVAATAAAVLWIGRDPPTAAAITIDAGAPPPAALERTVLDIDSVPTGAEVEVVGVARAITPASIDVPPGELLTVRVTRPGYQPWIDDRITLRAGDTVRIRAPLVAALARLHVESDPPGGVVTLAGTVLGVTPLDRDDLAPGNGLELSVDKPGWQPATTTVDLRAGELTTVARSLRQPPKMGAIDLFIDGGWAEIYLRGKRVGRAPAKGLRLPVGRHRLKLVNPPTGRELSLEVVVEEGEVKYYRTQFAP